MSNILELRTKRAIKAALKTVGDTPPSTAVAGVPDAIAEHPGPRMRIDKMLPDEMRNTMESIQAMAGAQLRRFDAAGVVVMIFDSTGTSLMAIERPQRGGVTDDYIREACARVAGVTEEEG